MGGSVSYKPRIRGGLPCGPARKITETFSTIHAFAVEKNHSRRGPDCRHRGRTGYMTRLRNNATSQISPVASIAEESSMPIVTGPNRNPSWASGWRKFSQMMRATA